jgi:hypothetical protein
MTRATATTTPQSPSVGTTDPPKPTPSVAPTPSAKPSAKATSRSVRKRRIRPGPVFIVGDSLTVGAQPWLDGVLTQRGWRVTGIDARIGRGVPEGLGILQSQAATLPDTVLIALGTNNLSSSPEAVTAWMHDARRIAGSSRRIIWVDLCLDDSAAPRLGAYRAVNDALLAAAPRFGIDMAHWCDYSSAHDIHPIADGIHYDDAAYQMRALFYADVLGGA